MAKSEGAIELQGKGSSFVDEVVAGGDKNVDDDGKPKRTGTLWTASAHIITAVIGSGVLSLAWAIAQLGWIAGPAVLMAFSFITFYTSTLLADCYRSPVTGRRNHTYMDAVRSNLGGMKIRFCGINQYTNLFGTAVGYTITSAISMAAIQRSDCFHKRGHNTPCHFYNNPYMLIFGGAQVILSQIPNFHKLWWLSYVAAAMSFTYSGIGVSLALAQVVGGGLGRTSLTGVAVGVDVTGTEKIWRAFQALGDIAFAYSYSMILIEIQDTLKSAPPENKVMKKASFVGVSVTTLFYMACGCLGYAAFGNDAPGNFLTGFGFYEPFWLIDFANLCIVIHLLGAWQVYTQPVYAFIEDWAASKWQTSDFINKEHVIILPYYGAYSINMFRLLWRTAYVVLTTAIAMAVPFFNDIMGLLGALAFWPLTVYFPIEMFIARNKVKPFTFRWTWLQVLSMGCLLISVAAAVGSVQGIVVALHTSKPFQSYS
ncbi:amino acid permease 6-like [Nymphaea colorata]|nr:amino acid permease 6-like [Nymphaea colorata]